jgi:hypothetical protein
MASVRSYVWLSAALALACSDDAGPADVPETRPPGASPDGAVVQRDGGELDARTYGEMDAKLELPEAAVSEDAEARVDGSASDAATAVLDAASPSVCAPSACPNPDYPCAPSDDGAGHSCLGQFAAWPMPDSQPGAKVAPRYTAMAAEGVVLDEVTGLLWQREVPALYTGCTRRLVTQPGDGCTWAEARAYCEQLTLAGRSWRLPSKVEMESLIDSTAAFPSPRIDLVPFPGTPATEPFWTGARGPVCGGEGYACQLYTLLGFAAPAQRVSAAALVRCVHSERVPDASGARFSRAGDVISDRFTTLQWHAQRSPLTPTPADAEAYCSGLEGNWRVPTIKELASLADEANLTSADDPIFALMADEECFWSATEGLASAGRLFYFALSGLTIGANILEEQPELGLVMMTRCVR